MGAAALLVLVFAATQDGISWPADGVGTLLWALEEQTADGMDVWALGIVAFNASCIAAIQVPVETSVRGRDGRLAELGDLGEAEGWKGCCDAVASLLGTDVAGYVVADCADFAAYCDAVGPIPVDCMAPVARRGMANGQGAIDIQRGRQKLTGSEVLAYVDGASSVATAERWEQAVRGILAAGRASEWRDEPVILRVASNLGGGQLAQAWQAFSRPDASVNVREIATALVLRDGVMRRVAKAVETEELVATFVRSEDPLTPGDVSVVVFNGNGARLAATQAAGYLQARGFRVPRIGNADTFDYTTTTIVRLTDEARAWILRESLPGTAQIKTPVEFGAHYEALRPLIPPGTDLVLVVGAGAEWGL